MCCLLTGFSGKCVHFSIHWHVLVRNIPVLNMSLLQPINCIIGSPGCKGHISEQQVIAACQQVVDSYLLPRPLILHGGSQAYYAPASDRVQMPELKSFVSSQAYHAALFHELIHSTGHPDRLNRFTEEEKASRFGDENYSKEELITEMGASFLSAFTGIKEAVFGSPWLTCRVGSAGSKMTR